MQTAGKEIARRIAYAMERAGLSCRDAEEQTGISKSTIQRYTADASKCSLPRLELIAKACGVTPAYLMGWEEDPTEGIPGAIRLERRTVPVLGSIACGEPITAEENMDIDIETDIQCDYALRCKGASMEPILRDGDLVLVRKQDHVESGEIAVVLIDDEATLKRVHHIPGGILLTAENPAVYQPKVYSEEEVAAVRILGKAIAFQRLL